MREIQEWFNKAPLILQQLNFAISAGRAGEVENLLASSELQTAMHNAAPLTWFSKIGQGYQSDPTFYYKHILRSAIDAQHTDIAKKLMAIPAVWEAEQADGIALEVAANKNDLGHLNVLLQISYTVEAYTRALYGAFVRGRRDAFSRLLGIENAKQCVVNKCGQFIITCLHNTAAPDFVIFKQLLNVAGVIDQLQKLSEQDFIRALDGVMRSANSMAAHAMSEPLSSSISHCVSVFSTMAAARGVELSHNYQQIRNTLLSAGVPTKPLVFSPSFNNREGSEAAASSSEVISSAACNNKRPRSRFT